MSRVAWTRELIIERIREWTELAGTPPTNADWAPALACRIGHPEIAAAFADADGYWPGAQTVARRFGTWTNGLRAALDSTPLEPDTYRAVGTQSSWTRELIIARAREWAAIYGRLPRVCDWEPSQAPADEQERAYERRAAANGHWPSVWVAKQYCGSWSAMVAAAHGTEAAPTEQTA